MCLFVCFKRLNRRFAVDPSVPTYFGFCCLESQGNQNNLIAKELSSMLLYFFKNSAVEFAGFTAILLSLIIALNDDVFCCVCCSDELQNFLMYTLTVKVISSCFPI